ncbi:alpha/beta fold hydrolase [Bradyrhizobium canariense]|uniref:alpha/beta fold hydrolase n=1 Tax=Bradyrhizobium canariense TaxID=255045 RepID=UPI000A19AB6C|nr:alpha/beta hydrolase [Bradyrhizobium canariense]OSI24355.1 alpha/beta hydrolase [Bradyrhizobium canariense]OSI29648.1 alpha/beta hydrolase [Bradyrhizobium canariense]OSI46479.1 alpha/beta hydrolase [Bradyrhizobium canariense]OSI53919.1 alpha/beta hydrolase [Bradyrhizobium canariense]OSI56868.1 alpha/beta hydrolase [Bradyrhizobium canariense]
MTDISNHTIEANGIRQHYIEAGRGAPVVLLHGFPFTNFTWRHQIPELAKRYRVIAPDLRGYGETDKPVAGYDKRNMAKDLRELMRKLDIERIALVGHDRGARVATRFAKDYPDATDRLVVMDNVPTRIIARDFNFSKMAKTYWLFLFHLKLDLPEIFISGREEQWLRHLFSEWCYNPHAISGPAFETYVAAYRSPGAVRGALADYRANADDLAQDLADADVKIACPTLSIWGAEFDGVGKAFDMPAIWAEMASDLSTFAVPRCGHVPQEEQPDLTNNLLLEFLDGWAGERPSQSS